MSAHKMLAETVILMMFDCSSSISVFLSPFLTSHHREKDSTTLKLLSASHHVDEAAAARLTASASDTCAHRYLVLSGLLVHSGNWRHLLNCDGSNPVN